MTLEAEEFIRRFLLHVLPEGLQRIRYYGFPVTDTENKN
jgi:Putative transposase